MSSEMAGSYLRRIGFAAPAVPSPSTLDALIAHHLQSVPFETIDIVRLRRPIVLDPLQHVRKIVQERRGGFCYELDGAFGWLLQQLGYRVTYGYGQWRTSDGRWVEPFDHMVLAVEVPESDTRWLADVGFGADCPTVAIPIDAARACVVNGRNGHDYRSLPLQDSSNRWRIETRQADSDWRLVYEADLTPRQFADYADRCESLQTSPDSHFTHDLICSLPVAGGRATIGGGRFILTESGHRTEQPITSRLHELDLLLEWFGIRIDPATYGVTT